MNIAVEQIEKAQFYFTLTYYKKNVSRFHVSLPDFIQECWVKFLSIGYDMKKSSLKTFCHMISFNVAGNFSHYYNHKDRMDSFKTLEVLDKHAKIGGRCALFEKKPQGVEMFEFLDECADSQKKDNLRWELRDVASNFTVGGGKIRGDFLVETHLEDPSVTYAKKKISDVFGINVSTQCVYNWKKELWEELKNCYI